MIAGLKPYAETKDSDVAWLGDVPAHWETRKLRTVLRSETSRNQPNLPLLSVVRAKGVVLRDVSSKEENHNFIPDDLTNYKVVHRGQFVMNKMKAWQGSYGVSNYDGIVSPAYFTFDLLGVDGEFFHSAIRSQTYVSFFAQASDGVRIGQWDLSQSRMKEIPFVVPPPDEQAAIVRFLDHADRRIRRAIAVKQKLIRLLEEQKQAIIHRAVTRGLDPDVRLKPSGVEWLGDVPEHWEVRRAKSICLDIVDCKNRTPVAVDGGSYFVVRTTCIRNGRFSLTGSYATDEENFDIWTARGAPKIGDVFFTREAPAGEACLVPDRTDLCMGQRMMYFRPDPELLVPEFLLLSIYGPLTRTYVELATNGSTVGHLRLGQVYGLPILWCPVDEQRAIVRYVREETQEIERTQANTEREVALLREYRTRLIADVVTGKLDVREAAAQLPEAAGPGIPDDEAPDAEGDDEMSPDEAQAEDETA